MDRETRCHRLRPLQDLEAALDRFHLRWPSPRATAAPAPADLPALKPSFKDLTDDTLLALRQHLQGRRNLAGVEAWAERLLRFCELRRRSLRSRALAKCGSSTAARLHILNLAAFLLDCAAHSGDLRFLNVVLKIADLRWVMNRHTIRRDLAGKGDRQVAALFQFRILVMTESALHRLRGDAAP